MLLRGNILIKIIIICLLLVCRPTGAPAANLTVGFLVGYSGLGDQSFNDMTYAGLIRAKRELGIRLILEDMEKSEPEAEAAFRRLVAAGVNVVVAGGFNFLPLIRKYAPLHENIHFILHDAVLEGLPNVVSTDFAVNEGSFLAGVLAGMMTETGRIAFIGGVDTPIMHFFRGGFREGVLHVNPEAEIFERFVTKEPDFSGFNAPERGHEMAVALYDTGVDIIYSAAGLTGNGVLKAAMDKKRYAIGVDSDQDHLAEGYVLTSMMKRLDIATYNEIYNIHRNRFIPGVRRYGLLEDGVGLSPMRYTRHLVPARVHEKLKAAALAVKLGRLIVPRCFGAMATTP